MKINEIEKMIRKYLLLIGLLVLVILNFHKLLDAIQVLWAACANIVFAAMFAYVVNIIMVRIERIIAKSDQPVIKKIKRPLSLLLSLTILVLIVYILMALVFPALSEAVEILAASLPKAVSRLQDYLLALFNDNPKVSQLLDKLELNWKELLSNALAFVGNSVGNVVGTTLSMITTIASSLFNLLLIVIFAIYILLDKERFIRMYERLGKLYLKAGHKARLDQALKIIHHSFSAFIGGQCLEAVILGTLCAIGMLILQMPYAVMVGTLVGVINIIPIVGAYIGGAIGMFMVFTVDPMLSLGFLTYLIILQQFESNVIYPRVVGNSIGLPGIYVLGAVMVFGALAGIPGMLLGIPTVASIYQLAKIYIAEKEAKLAVRDAETKAAAEAEAENE